MRALLPIFCLVLQANAEGWDDFTNNLATDLAPLIALFGEQATKQFLSESTSFLDNIIFAVAPLGILTAVVSVIRVLGSASLRAFIGRAQEGRGLAEAELCSSTSHDVCELWNNGGIARVFGRPKILEFIFDEDAMSGGKNNNVPDQHGATHGNARRMRVNPMFYEVFDRNMARSFPMAGLYKPEDYVKRLPEENENSVLPPHALHPKKFDDREKRRRCFAPNPNLSLNVGIQKPSRVTLWGAAIFGCLLQASVLGFGAWAVYVKDLRKEGGASTQPYFWLTITGTLLLSVGMCFCAWLIERSTQEKRFKLRKQVFWLQPGNQRVGDQNFEAFAYSTNLKEYTTSWKEEEAGRGHAEWRRKLFVWAAVSTSMIGFVLQFTGLRGMHASVAVYQLAATLVMAFIRSLLRTQRLKESENLLQAREFQALVEGHELDWQTLRIESTIKAAAKKIPSKHQQPRADPSCGTPSDKDVCWTIIETPFKIKADQIKKLKTELLNELKTDLQAELAVNEFGSAAGTSSCHDYETGGGDQEQWDANCANALIKWIARVERQNEAIHAYSESPNVAKKLLCYRSSLSFYTNEDAPTTDQQWGLAVRDQAIKLQEAIESVANYVFSDACQAVLQPGWEATAAFCWALPCVTTRHAGATSLPIHLMVHRIRGWWRIDINQLEAVLSLETWSIKTEVERDKIERGRIRDAQIQDATSAHHNGQERPMKKAAPLEDAEAADQGTLLTSYDYQAMLSRKVFTTLRTGDLDERKRAERHLNTWILRERRQPVYDNVEVEEQNNQRRSEPFSSLSLPKIRNLLIGSHPQPQQQLRQNMQLASIQVAQTELGMVSQDIFTSFIDALATITKELKGINLVQSFRSDSTTAEEIMATSRARPFLGLSNNHTEQLMNLFLQAELGSRDEALLSVIPPFHSRFLLPSLMMEYEQLKSQARKLGGEARWSQAENLLTALRDEVKNNPRDTENIRQSEELFRECGELYRKAMSSADPSHRLIGYRGIYKMLQESTNVTERMEDIRRNYSWVALQVAKLHKEMLPAPLQNTIQDRDVGPDISLGTTLQEVMGLDSAYPVGLLVTLRFKSLIFKADRSAQTQLLIWAARKGCKELVEELLAMGLDVNGLDQARRTPLSHACEEGAGEVVEILLEAGANGFAVDDQGCTPFARAARAGHVDLLRFLMQKNVDFDNGTAGNEGTSLTYAVYEGHEAAVRLLVESGKVEFSTESFFSAVRNGCEGIVKLLLDTHKVYADYETFEETPLFCAVKHGHGAIVQLLLDTGRGDINWKNRDGQSALSYAASRGDRDVVRQLLDVSFVDVNSEDDALQTPLLLAAKFGHKAVVKLLLGRSEVKLGMMDRTHGRTPLGWAAFLGHEGICRLLLDTGKVLVDVTDRNMETALSLAAKSGHEGVVKLLLDTGRVKVNLPLLNAARYGHERVFQLLLDTKKADIHARGSKGQTPLFSAAQGGSRVITKLLLDEGKDEIDIEARNAERKTPLFIASESGKVGVVKLLLERGRVDINAKDNDGDTPLSIAARYRHVEIVKLLLDKKADINARNKKGETALFDVASRGHGAVVELLLNQGKEDIEVNAKANRGATPLSEAVICKHFDVVKLLLDTGRVDINSKDERGRTPLSIAATHGHTEIVKLLLDTDGVDINSRDEEEGTPLICAVGREDITKLLLATKKADINARNNKGETALFAAARWGVAAMVQLLLDQDDVEVDARTTAGQTPLAIAIESRNLEVVELLVDSSKVDVNSADDKGETPLSLAKKRKLEEVIKLLEWYAAKRAQNTVQD